MSQKIVSVFGSSAPRPGSADYEAARTLGQMLAHSNFAVQTGGYSGVMAGVSQGANEAGGHVIGITSAQIEQFRGFPANQWVLEEIQHETLRERLIYLVDHCDACIVLPGGIGTLSELSLIWSFVQVGEISPRPIIVVGELWQRTLTAFNDETYIVPAHFELITLVATLEEAVQILISHFAG